MENRYDGSKELLDDLLADYENRLSKAEVKYVKAVGKRASAYARIKEHDLSEKISVRYGTIIDIQQTIKTINKLKN